MKIFIFKELEKYKKEEFKDEEKEFLKDFSFEGVGVYLKENLCTVILPKYYQFPEEKKYFFAESIETEDLESYKEEIVKIVKLIQKYNKRELSEGNSYLDNYENELTKFDKSSLYHFLLDDFIENGFYEEDEEKYEENPDGEIDWDYTVNNEMGYLTENNKKIIYINYYGKVIENKKVNLVKEIQKSFINKASEYLKKFNFLGLYFPVVKVDTNFDLEIFSKEYYINILNKALRETFNERKIRLIKILKTLLEEDRRETGSYSLFTYYTNSFYSIWEAICKYSFKNIFEKHKNEFNQEVKLNDNPDKITLIPDIFSEYDKDKFAVIDAKYYSTKEFEEIEEGLKDSKSNNDEMNSYNIIKQFLYQGVFRKILLEKQIVDKNIFILPMQISFGEKTEKDIKLKKSYSIPFFEGDKIYSFTVNPNILIENYLNDKLEKNLLKEIINEINEKENKR